MDCCRWHCLRGLVDITHGLQDNCGFRATSESSSEIASTRHRVVYRLRASSCSADHQCVLIPVGVIPAHSTVDTRLLSVLFARPSLRHLRRPWVHVLRVCDMVVDRIVRDVASLDWHNVGFLLL